MILNIRIWRNNREWVTHHRRVIVPFKPSRAHTGIFVRVEKFRRLSRYPVPPPTTVNSKSGANSLICKRHDVIRQIEHTVELPRLETTYKFHRTLLVGLSIRGERFPLRDRHVAASRELRRFALSPVTPGLFAARGPRQGLWETQTDEGETVCAVLCSDGR